MWSVDRSVDGQNFVLPLYASKYEGAMEETEMVLA